VLPPELASCPHRCCLKHKDLRYKDLKYKTPKHKDMYKVRFKERRQEPQ